MGCLQEDCCKVEKLAGAVISTCFIYLSMALLCLLVDAAAADLRDYSGYGCCTKVSVVAQGAAPCINCH